MYTCRVFSFMKWWFYMKSDISGFPEFLPHEQIAFQNMTSIIRYYFELYGFIPMDTAAVERVHTLLAKGNDSEIYGLYRLADIDAVKKNLGLRFDLTVPFARYVSSNYGQMTFPHKRYQIAPVWRGERAQHGRYRQFYQCDIDVIADGELSQRYDAEVVLLFAEILLHIGVKNFHTKINNRKILSGFLKSIIHADQITDALRIIDKIDKITPEEFTSALRTLSITDAQISNITNFLQSEEDDNEQIINRLKKMEVNEEFSLGVDELYSLIMLLRSFGLNEKHFKISMRLARGLNYYTGVVFETVLNDAPEIGSIAGGGRYDNLTETICNKKFPGVGGTIGISRLVPMLIEKNILNTDKHSTADVLVTVQDPNCMDSYINIANVLRQNKIKTEIYLQNKSLSSQLNYANKKGMCYAIIANEDELLRDCIIVRNLKDKTQVTGNISHLISHIMKTISEHDFLDL